MVNLPEFGVGDFTVRIVEREGPCPLVRVVRSHTALNGVRTQTTVLEGMAPDRDGAEEMQTAVIEGLMRGGLRAAKERMAEFQ